SAAGRDGPRALPGGGASGHRPRRRGGARRRPLAAVRLSGRRAARAGGRAGCGRRRAGRRGRRHVRARGGAVARAPGPRRWPPMTWLGALLPPDLWQNEQVTNALLVGAVAAVVSAALGYFVVLRGLSFAGHAVTDIGLAGGAGAVLLGLNALWGLLAFCVLAAAGIDLLGQRARERDVATGVVLALALGLGALFLYVGTRYVSEPATLLFGSIFAVDPAIIAVMVWIALGCLAVLAAL